MVPGRDLDERRAEIASDLLVSREAIAWRLYTLRLIDEVPRWLSGRRDEPVAAGEAS